jgi:hypothetical protein
MKFVQFIQKERGWEALDQVYRHLPQSTEQILHPEKYYTHYDTPERVVLPEFRFHGTEYSLVREGTVGELDMRILFEEYFRGTRAETAAAGWGGDRYELHRMNSDGSHVLRWVLVFDTERDAREGFELMHDMVPAINPGLILMDDSQVDHRAKWKRGRRLFYVERRGGKVLVLYNIPRDLFSAEIKILRTARSIKARKDIPTFDEDTGGTPKVELPSFSMGNTFPVDLSGGTMTGLSYTLNDENITLELPPTRWSMNMVELNDSIAFLRIENEDGSVQGQMQLVRFPIPIDIQTLAMSMELGTSMVEGATGSKKVRAGIIQVRKETAYEIVLEKRIPEMSKPVLIRQIFLPRNENFVLLSIMTSGNLPSHWEEDINFIIDSLCNNN